MAAEKKLIDLQQAFPRSRLHTLWRAPLEKFLALEQINRTYRDFLGAYRDGSEFFRTCLEVTGVTYTLRDQDLAKIPSEGPLVVVANHPFGGIEGVILGDLLTRVRPDVKLLGNYLLSLITEIQPWLISVDPFGASQSKEKNIAPLKETIRWLRQGGVLGTFPAGEVAHFRWEEKKIKDPPWSPHIASIIRKTRSTVIPVYFDGRNSIAFQLAGLVHPRLRTALLAREFGNKLETNINLAVGKPIPSSQLEAFHNDEEITRYLRVRTEILRSHFQEKTPRRKLFARRQHLGQAPLMPAIQNQSAWVGEIAQLPEKQHLIDQGKYAVYLARAEQIPHLLQEIGRLREVTFRQVGEGSGNACDLDSFDEHYYHLFLWNKERSEVAGAYRLGLTDELFQKFGRSGLYTHSLFRFSDDFIAQLTPSLELGRSFISAPYQKSYNSLALLWKGIGAFVSQNPRYHILFGPVSISQNYNTLSKNLLVHFFLNKNPLPAIAKSVQPRKPYRPKKVLGIDVVNISDLLQGADDVSTVISEIEADGKGMPILLSQYIKMNATILNFNVDPQFSNVLDGLILVDVRETNQKLCKRFMGEKGYERFVQFHQESHPLEKP